MGKTFSIADAFQNVPNPGTDREQITYISADLLVSDEQNFYSMDKLDELAGNIQLVGLQQPIRVRPDGAGKYIIVSGHRRRAAIEQLRQEEPERWAEIPCIIEDRQESDAMRKLRLIYANAATRTMTNYDLQQQAKEVEALLYQLKEEGVEFPGRMRDHVAEACKASKSKLSRLKVIDEHLTRNTDAQKAWKSGDLSETTAYALAHLDPALQDEIVKATIDADGHLRYLYENTIERLDRKLKDLEEKTCKKTHTPCIDHCQAKRKKQISVAVGRGYTYCSSDCCADCPSFATCTCVCDVLKEKQAEVRRRNKQEKQQAAEEQARRDAPKIAKLEILWERFGTLREQAGLTFDEFKERIDRRYMSVTEKEAEAYEHGYGIKTTSHLPYGYSCDVGGIECLCAAADALHASLDYLFGRTSEPRTAEEIAAGMPIGQTMIAGWMPGGTNPGHSCQCVVDFTIDGEGEPIRSLVNWNAQLGQFVFCRGGLPIEAEPIRWMELPEVE